MVKHHTINIERINSELVLIESLQNLISSSYTEIFYAVIVNGSVATDEVISYSDFDGLLIIKDSYSNSSLLKQFLKDSMRLILKFDPLQHHGWFMILESELLKYPQSYLPHEVLKYSKLLFPFVDNLEMKISTNDTKSQYREKLNFLISNIEAQCKSNFKNMTIYDLKSFLSKIMLIPSMYYSVKYNRGIFKKQSFDLVKTDFTSDEWKCIQIASDIRINWKYNLSLFQKIIMTRQELFFRKLTKLFFAPKIDSNTLNLLNENFFKSLKILINKIKKNENY